MRIFTAAAALLLGTAAATASAQSVTYCSAPSGYVATNCFGDACEYTTDAFYDGYIGPALEVSRDGQNCSPLSDWQYYSLTSQPGTVSMVTAGASSAAAPEIDPDEAISALTLCLGVLTMVRGRRSKPGWTVAPCPSSQIPNLDRAGKDHTAGRFDGC